MTLTHHHGGYQSGNTSRDVYHSTPGEVEQHDAGVLAGTVMMPVLPFIEDTVENVAAIVEANRAAGGGYIIPAFGMTLRDRQRAWYYSRINADPADDVLIHLGTPNGPLVRARGAAPGDRVVLVAVHAPEIDRNTVDKDLPVANLDLAESDLAKARAVIGLVPLAAGVFDWCFFAPLFRLPFAGPRLRQTLE